MNVTKEEKIKLENIYQKYFNNDKIAKMKQIRQHRGSNCFIHSFLVAKYAIKIAMKRKQHLDLVAILIAGILHDYYLYDWRLNKKLLKTHGSEHPKISNQNAIRDFAITQHESQIILSHMWPLNFNKYPKTLEAKLVSLADKHIAIREALTSKRYKQRHLETTLNKLKTLF